jgi:hypothetical protein
MPTKKKATTKKKKKGSRVGAMALNPSSPLVQWGSIGLGYLVFAKPIASAVDKALVSETDPDKLANKKKMIYGGMTLGGAYFQFMDKGKKSIVKTVLSGVAIGAGLKNGLSAFGIGQIGGYGAVKVLNGYGEVRTLNGRKMNGYITPGQVGGYVAPGQVGKASNVMGQVRKSNSNLEDGTDSGSGSGLVKDYGSSLVG